MRIENSFIPIDGVGKKTERLLWRSGITHWDDFDGSVVGERKAERIFNFIEVGRNCLKLKDSRFFYHVLPSGSQWRLYENFRDDACFFDIETTGLSPENHDVTMVSFHHTNKGETTTLVKGQNLTYDSLSRELERAKLLVSFNGKRFDVPFLEHEFSIEVDLPHIDLMYPCRKLGLTGGLKQIEKDLKIERDRPDISGKDAIRLWEKYQRGNGDALDTLVSYNRDDAANLKPVMDTVAGMLHEEVFERACDP